MTEITGNIKITDKDNICRIKLSGEANINFVNAFRRTAQELENRSRLVTLVIDMENVTYIDSASLSIFVRLIKIYRKKNKSILVYRPQQNIVDLFKVTNLNNLLTICSTEEELKEKLGKKKAGK
jgi:anti-anti-sigma factor